MTTTFALQWVDPDTRCPATSFHGSEAAADAAAVVLVRGGVAHETWIFEVSDPKEIEMTSDDHMGEPLRLLGDHNFLDGVLCDPEMKAEPDPARIVLLLADGHELRIGLDGTWEIRCAGEDR